MGRLGPLAACAVKAARRLARAGGSLDGLCSKPHNGRKRNGLDLSQSKGTFLSRSHVPPQLMATPGTDLVQYDGVWRVTSTLTGEAASKGIDLSKLPHVTGSFNVIAFLVICLVTVVLVIGIKESATLNTIIVFIKVGTVLVFIGIAARFVLAHPSLAAANWHPFIPPNTGEYGRFGWSGIGRGAAVFSRPRLQ